MTTQETAVENTANENKKNTRTSSFKEKESDPGFLVAKGRFNGASENDLRDAERTHVKSLASAIFMAMQNCGYANIRAVGRNATYNAIKAIAIAKSYCAPKGIELCWDVSFDEGNLGALRNQSHVSTVTAMLFSLKGFKDWVEPAKE